MIDFYLRRQYYNNTGTWGELSCETFKFKCTTFEQRPMPAKIKKPTSSQKAMFCIPCGTYDLLQKWQMDWEKKALVLNMQIATYGTFAHTEFVGEKRKMKIGTILLTRNFEDIGSKEVLRVLQDNLAKAEIMGYIPSKAKKGYMRLIVEEAETYHAIADVEEEDEEEELFHVMDFT